MARERTYGWSPKQLAQINARREARGQDPYIDRRMREDAGYRSDYTTASEDYANRQAGIQQRQQDRDTEQERKRTIFARQSLGLGDSMRQREQEREDLARMNVDYLKMRQSGRNINWEDFKKMWKGKKISTPPNKQNAQVKLFYT
jgi:hypothetical protein